MAGFRIGDSVVHVRGDIKVPMKIVNLEGWTATCVWTENGKEEKCGFVLGVLERC